MAKGIDWGRQIGRRLKLRDLHVFMTVAQAGGMAKGANELGIAQPVVSAAIAGLESAIGLRLFERSSRGVELTPYGRVLMKGEVAAFDTLKQSISEMEFLADPTGGEVRIGCPETVAALLPPIFESIRSRHAGVTFHITEVATPSLDLPQLRDRTLDVVVLRTRWPLPQQASVEDFVVEQLFDDETVVVVGSASPLARRRKVDLSELLHQEWILPPSDTTNSLVVMEAYRARGLPLPRVSFVTFSVTLRASMLATGRYVSVLPRSMMYLYARQMSLKVLPVKLAARKWPVVIVTLKNRSLNPIAKTFIQHLKAGVTQLTRKAY